jgi:hypothetical protein
MSSNSLLVLISDNDQDRAFAAAAAQTAGLRLVPVRTFAEAGPFFVEMDKSSCVLAEASSREQCTKLESVVKEKGGAGLSADRVHAISPELLGKAPYVLQGNLVGNYVWRNFHDPKAAGERYGRIISAINTPGPQALSTFLDAESKWKILEIPDPSAREAAVAQTRSFLEEAKIQPRIASVVAGAIDELVINALVAAPVDVLGNRLYQSIGDLPAVRLVGRATVTVQLGFDSRQLAVRVLDQFGSLSRGPLFLQLSQSYREFEYKVTDEAGVEKKSTGIGLATLFQSGASLFFRCKPRVRTEVTAFFLRTDSFREFREEFRFVSTQVLLFCRGAMVFSDFRRTPLPASAPISAVWVARFAALQRNSLPAAAPTAERPLAWRAASAQCANLQMTHHRFTLVRSTSFLTLRSFLIKFCKLNDFIRLSSAGRKFRISSMISGL